MTAIQAEFVQIKQMKSKPIGQLIFEFPIENANEILKALGWPNPHESIWCGIARLNTKIKKQNFDASKSAIELQAEEIGIPQPLVEEY